MTKHPPPQPEGLVGFYGHTSIPDPKDADAPMIQYQFQIVRKIDDTRYALQLFSFMDGSPTSLSVMTETELLGPKVKLYATAENWNEGYEKDAERRWQNQPE